MKLKKYNQEEYYTYWHNQQPIDVPEYVYQESSLRGVWVSNVVNIDTPMGLSEEAFKKYLSEMVANIASYNMNAIIFQVRPTNDAYYPSKLNPWSRFITGTEGQTPGFDVLQYVIEEAKKYQMVVHAWMNPYRVSMQGLDVLQMTKEEYLNTLDDKNFAKCFPEHTIIDGANKVILAPSHPEVIKFVTETIMEVVENYDIEGVHIDDYFYPYAKIPEAAEEADYQKYRLNVEQSFDDFRRHNVDIMIKSIHDAMLASYQRTGKKVQFGISPFAIYRTHKSIKPTGWEFGSYHSAGALECYSELYSDVYKWMKEGWIDYIVPQIYFPFGRSDVTYHDLTLWWSNICKETGTTLYIGQGLYQVGSNDVWQDPEEIAKQLSFNCQFDNIKGTIFFTYHDLLKDQNLIKNAALDSIKKLWVSR